MEGWGGKREPHSQFGRVCSLNTVPSWRNNCVHERSTLDCTALHCTATATAEKWNQLGFLFLQFGSYPCSSGEIKQVKHERSLYYRWSNVIYCRLVFYVALSLLRHFLKDAWSHLELYCTHCRTAALLKLLPRLHFTVMSELRCIKSCSLSREISAETSTFGSLFCLQHPSAVAVSHCKRSIISSNTFLSNCITVGKIFEINKILRGQSFEMFAEWVPELPEPNNTHD